ncbi:MAG: hypothetical protein ABEJ40_05545 [Haloarculaceae archaeon]
MVAVGLLRTAVVGIAAGGGPGILGTVAMIVTVTAVLVVTAGLVLAGLLRLFDRFASSPDRAVLPSHYSSLLHRDPSNYPGYCPECGTLNDPEYKLCRNCSARIPTRRQYESDGDLEQVFGQ